MLKTLQGTPEEMERSTWDRASLASLRRKMVASVRKADSSSHAAQGWDNLEQLALGLAALEASDRALRGKEGPGLQDKSRAAALGRLMKLLAFPRDVNSPRGFREGDEFSARLNVILDELSR